MNKNNDKIVSAVFDALLSAGMTFDELITPNALYEEGTKNEVLADVFKRKRKDKSDVQVGAKFFTYEDVLTVCEEVDKPARNHNMQLACIRSMEDVHTYCDVKGYPKWSALSYEKKLDVLWDLGLAVKYEEEGVMGEDEEVSKYFISNKQHRKFDNSIVRGLCVTATERTDRAWKDSGYATQEAMIYTKDHELAKDLAQMGRM